MFNLIALPHLWLIFLTCICLVTWTGHVFWLLGEDVSLLTGRHTVAQGIYPTPDTGRQLLSRDLRYPVLPHPTPTHDSRWPQCAAYHRYLTSFTYPIIDSFPSIFSTDRIIPVEGSAVEDQRLAISTKLTTSSQVIPRLKSIKNVVSRVVGVDEREAILNDLGEFIEGFETGWNSGSDDNDDWHKNREVLAGSREDDNGCFIRLNTIYMQHRKSSYDSLSNYPCKSYHRSTISLVWQANKIAKTS